MNTWASISFGSWLRICTVACAGGLGVVCPVGMAQAPAASGDYTTALPSVAKVEAQIQGTDATDTAARQVAVFEYLQVYIQRIKETRDYRGPYSPGELKLRTDYAKAQYDLTQSFTKSHTPQEVATFGHLEGNYSINNALDWIKQLEGQQAADTYRGAEQSLSQSYQRNQDRIQQGLQQSNGQSSGGLMGGLMGGGGNVDLKPEQKRCLELGGTLKQCANAMMGLVNLIGNIVAMGAEDNTPQQPPLSGVILIGTYHSRTDLPEVALAADGMATLSKCGTLVDLGRRDTIRKSSAATQIVLDNEPDPIVLTLRADGSLAGPGNVPVKGSIITGYNNVTTCTRGGTPYASCGTTSTPIYSASMQRCTVRQLAPQPAPPAPAKPTGMVGQVSDMFGMGDAVATMYGFRMIGPYASSDGMQLAFANGYVTLDCGKAHVNAPYTVENTASGFVVHVQNGGGAFLLAVAPDTTLRGAGWTTVSGRLVTAVQGENVSFAPHAESCRGGRVCAEGQAEHDGGVGWADAHGAGELFGSFVGTGRWRWICCECAERRDRRIRVYCGLAGRCGDYVGGKWNARAVPGDAVVELQRDESAGGAGRVCFAEADGRDSAGAWRGGAGEGESGAGDEGARDAVPHGAGMQRGDPGHAEVLRDDDEAGCDREGHAGGDGDDGPVLLFCDCAECGRRVDGVGCGGGVAGRRQPGGVERSECGAGAVRDLLFEEAFDFGDVVGAAVGWE